MTSHQDKIDALNGQIEEAKKDKAMQAALDRLLSNQDFQEVIMEGFLKKYALRTVNHLAEPNFRAEERDVLIQTLDGIAVLNRWLQLIDKFGKMADDDIKDAEATLDEIREETGEDV